MRYCSIDIETTGLNPDTCDILQFAAVLDDLNDPKPLVDLLVLPHIFTKMNLFVESHTLSVCTVKYSRKLPKLNAMELNLMIELANDT